MCAALALGDSGTRLSQNRKGFLSERTQVMKKVSPILLPLTASAVRAGVPAVAQLGGALGSTLGGHAQARGNRGGVGAIGSGGLGSTDTLGGTMRGQRHGLDL